jgi:hypothetical protein
MPAFARRVGIASAAGALVALVAGVACLPGSGPALNPYVDDSGAPPPIDLGGDARDERQDVDLGDPFSITGLAPSHGPWNGGTRATLRGRGFSSTMRVWIGGTEIPASDRFASDPTRAAVVTPAGTPGPADVKIRDDATAQERTLPAGFFYDAFVVEPSSGATSGGTRIALTGSGTQWIAGTTVAIDGKPCTDVAIIDATHMQCTTPGDTPGTKDVVVTLPDTTFTQARDAYTFSDSYDGYRGGLSGGALSGHLRVLAFDAWEGTPIPGANVIAGGNIASAIIGTTDASGVALLNDPRLAPSVTVTVAAKCHQPMSFVGVPVDTATVYLTPSLDLSCASGDPPSSGNYGSRDASIVQGELIWAGSKEGQKSDWRNVPMPQRSTERRAAYVFVATGSPTDQFYLPDAMSAVTLASPGVLGYGYSITVSPGNLTVYALAGIEDRSVAPARFTAYAMGVVRGVPATPQTQTTGVDIPMTTLLDHEVTLTPSPPPTTPRGPDRFFSQIAVTVGTNSWAHFPNGSSMTLLPVGGNVVLAGVPALDGTLAGESYTITAAAVTGANQQTPASIITRINTTDSNSPVAVAGFPAIPVLREPSSGAWGGTHVRVDVGSTVDLLILDVTSGGGLILWQIIAPGTTTTFDLPDLSGLPNNVGLVHGTIVTTAYVARINAFDYAKLRYGNLGSGSWNAYAIDSATGSY